MHDAEQEFVFRMDARVDEIGERVSKIEGILDKKTSKPLRQRISEYGGLVALFLSIAIGSFAVVDKFVFQPEKDVVLQEMNFRHDVNELVGIVAAISGLDWINNQQGAAAAAQAYTPQRLALIEQILQSDSVMPAVLQFADRLLLANEFETFGRLQEALRQAELAHESAADPLQTANAYWAKARLNGRLNQLAAMRDTYLLALTEFKSLGMATWAGSVMQIYTQWIANELVVGTCATARDALSRMIEDFRSPDVWPATKQYVGDQFTQMLSQSPRTCDLVLSE